MKPTLVIFVKEPLPGRVKTRLGAGIGMVAAAQWFRRQSLSLVRRLSRNRLWRTVLAVSPDRAGMASRFWPAHLPRWPQRNGDLGARMSRALRENGPGPVVIVGADIPGIEPHHIAAAFDALGRHDAVLGPAPDGGYWLVGMRGARVPSGFMEGVRWSHAKTLEDTLATLPAGARVAMLDVLDDVDTVEDLNRSGAS